MKATVTGFARFCREHLVVEDGSPMRLRRFQREMLADHFAGARESVCIVPKKNGKSSLLAALGLYRLLLREGTNLAIVAASRDQAMYLFEQMRGFVQRSPYLQEHVSVRRGYREIRRGLDHRDFNGLIRVYAADADTFDGWLGDLAFVDELHRHKSAELYGVLRDGLGPRKGQMITISTAGASMDSPLGQLRRQAHELKGFRRSGAHNYARSSDRSFAFHEWCLEPSDDVTDMRVVKRANPAPWQTPAELRRRHDSPSMTPWQWRRFGCGIWTEGEEPWLDPEAWDRLEGEVELPEDIWAAVDLGVRHDSTAIVLAAEVEGTLHVEARVLRPPVAVGDVEEELRELAETYRLRGIAYDPWSFRRSAEMLEAEGLPMLEHPMTPERMSIVSAGLYERISKRALRHSGDPILRAHVLAGVTKETERGWRLVKDPRARRPIDALIALAMAAHVAGGRELEQPTPRLISLEAV